MSGSRKAEQAGLFAQVCHVRSPLLSKFDTWNTLAPRLARLALVSGHAWNEMTRYAPATETSPQPEESGDPVCWNCLVLRMQAYAEHRNGTAVAIVGRIDDELIVERDPRSKHRKAIIGLEDFFVAGMRQHAVANQDSKSAGVEKRLVHVGDAVDDAGNAEHVVIPPPLLSRYRQAGGHGAVDIREFIGFFVAIRESGAG